MYKISKMPTVFITRFATNQAGLFFRAAFHIASPFQKRDHVITTANSHGGISVIADKSLNNGFTYIWEKNCLNMFVRSSYFCKRTLIHANFF